MLPSAPTADTVFYTCHFSGFSIEFSVLAGNSFFFFPLSSSENSLLLNQLTGSTTTDLAAVLHQCVLRLPSGVMLDNQPFYMKKHVEKSKVITCVKSLSSAVPRQG